jgi:hypothetical protein
LALGAVLVIGCSVRVGGQSAEPAQKTSGPVLSADPAETTAAVDKLRKSTAFVDQASFRSDIDIAGQIMTIAHVDNGKKRGDFTTTNNGATVSELRMIDDDVYMKLAANQPGVGDKWMIIDQAKVPAGFTLSFAQGKNDPGAAARLFDAIVAARVAGNEVAGTLDVG